MILGQKDFDISRVIGSLIIILLLSTLWIITRPNVGLTGDAQFYAIQVLHAINPSHYAQDLYFKFGSQDNFSIFSTIYKPFVLIFSLDRADEILGVLSQVLWIGAVTHLARTLYRDRIVVITALAAVILLPSIMDFVRVGEPYLTPRPFSEAFTLIAIAEWLAGHRLRSWASVLLALAIHPLMALPGAALIGLDQALRQRAWWFGLAGVVVVTVLLAVKHVSPFAELLQRFDQPWLSVVNIRDSFCFVSRWTLGFWLPVLATYILAAIVFMTAPSSSRRLLHLSIVISVGGFLVSWLGGDIFHDVLIFGLQTWRSNWILTVVSHLMAGALVAGRQFKVRISVSTKILFNFSLASLFMFGFFENLAFVPTFLLACTAIIVFLERNWSSNPTPIIPFFCFSVIFFGCWVTIEGLQFWQALLINFPGARARGIREFSLAIATTMLLVIYIRWIELRSSLWTRMATFGVVLCLILVAFANWDSRSPWTRFVDAGNPPKSLTDFLPHSGSLYWEGDVSVPWFLLRRSSYFSCSQGTGVLFSRGTAMNYQKRYDVFSQLHVFDIGNFSICPSLAPSTPARPPWPSHTPPLRTADALIDVCRQSPGLSALVLIRPVSGVATHVWISSVTHDYTINDGPVPRRLPVNRYFIYRCDALG